MSCPNGATPLLLPISNITVSADGKAVNRGIEIGVGNPPQVLSVRPSVADSDLFVFNSADCSSAANNTCVGVKGGVFDPSKSSSYVLSTEAKWNGTHDDTLDTGSYIYFNDDLSFGAKGQAFGFPLMMDQPGQGSQGGLPIGLNSSFLEAAVSSGSAPSTSWGLWTGSRSISHPIDGMLVVGGYDKARVGGSWTNFPILPKCAACSTITDLKYVDASGSHSLLANATDEISIGIEPFQRALQMPQHVFEAFILASQGTYNTSNDAITYPATNPPNGTLQVTLENGYTTTIPATELFSKPRLFNDDGVYSIIDDTTVIATVGNSTSAGYVASWGIPFLTMNYMLMDYAKDHFQLAPAVRTDFGKSATDSAEISTICGPADGTININPVTNSTSSNSTSTNNTNSGSTHSAKSNTGAIVGGVVGGILGLALIVCAFAFLFWRTKRNKVSAVSENGTVNGTGAAGSGLGGKTISEAGDTRASIFTSVPPTEYSELASPQDMKMNGHGQPTVVSNWLNAQQQQHHEIGDEKFVTSASVSGPLVEMPADTGRRSP